MLERDAQVPDCRPRCKWRVTVPNLSIQCGFRQRRYRFGKVKLAEKTRGLCHFQRQASKNAMGTDRGSRTKRKLNESSYLHFTYGTKIYGRLVDEPREYLPTSSRRWKSKLVHTLPLHLAHLRGLFYSVPNQNSKLYSNHLSMLLSMKMSDFSFEGISKTPRMPASTSSSTIMSSWNSHCHTATPQ